MLTQKLHYPRTLSKNGAEAKKFNERDFIEKAKVSLTPAERNT